MHIRRLSKTSPALAEDFFDEYTLTWAFLFGLMWAVLSPAIKNPGGR